VIKYAKSDKFEHLATLVDSMVTNKLIKNVEDLSDQTLWKFVVKDGDKLFYIFEHGYQIIFKTSSSGQVQTDYTHFFFDIREPAVLTHLFIGGHLDGGLQGLYLYLKFVKRVPTASILQLMLDFLTSAKTTAEAGRIKLQSKLLMKADRTLVVPSPTPVDKWFADILELDETMISAATSP
jgi:hypothetical protein